jgi:beta-lactamase regulating signal transducer with metallopeptidase domain
LTLLGVAPVFGHHLTLVAALPLENLDRVGALCLVSLHLLLAPVHGVFHVLFFAGLLYASHDRARAWLRMRTALEALGRSAPVPARVASFASAAGLDLERMLLVRGLPNPAFTTGLFRPRVYLSAEIAERLGDAELMAVLAHEAAHARRRDPLRLSLVRFSGCALFWIPAVRRLTEDIRDEAEFAADESGAERDPLAMASALVTVAESAQGVSAPLAPGVLTGDLLERRVRRLAGEPVVPATHVTRRSMVLAAMVLLVAWTSGAVVAHPLPPSSAVSRVSQHHENCTDHPGPPFLHLFCRHYLPGPEVCDHESHLDH